MSERDRHFQGSAQCLWDKIEDKIFESSRTENLIIPEEIRSAIKTLIAQHDYDLALHVLSSPVVTEREAPLPAQSAEEVVKEIPDLFTQSE